MELIYKIKNKNLLIGGIVISGIVGFLLTQLVFANLTVSILPSSDGTYRRWIPKAGITHYTMVDELTCNGTNDYNFTNTVGNRDSYGVSLSSVPNGSIITAIKITPCASRNTTGDGSAIMNVFYRYNNVNSADAGNYELTGGGITPIQLAATTFSELSLMKSASSVLQIGAVLSAGTRGARLSHLAVVIEYTPLSAPSNLEAVNIKPNSTLISQSNLISWIDNSSNEDGFKIERSFNNQYGPFLQIATASTSATFYRDDGLTANQTYYYRARAFNAGGDSNYSNTDYAITATIVPNGPANLTVTAATSSSDIILNWTQNSTNEEGFRVERSVDNLSFAEIAATGINVINYLDQGLASSTSYYYRVRAFNLIGNSNYSNTASTTTP